ncbi:3-hydroxyisobutyryl-CoA hydrolase-like protein 5 isoform X1 [Selaginella moellendorffii]|nr:3-hydroxyisobutyryl-CoA hydrolase-like protein 5 isoform X1 [Selaginella moellendorffii]|eukprot:XP_002972598.2 3-hydroxyisobutyryl-CoA hydrolase-like protein 5 isoform X1 [Selaginella moellendorffii]
MFGAERASERISIIMGMPDENQMEEVLVDAHDRVRVMTLNRPQVLNCLNLSVVSRLAELFEQWERDESVELIIIKAAGKVFSAGGDLRMFYDHRKDESWKEVVYKKYWLDYHLYSYRKTRVAIWHGLVVGGGAGFTFPSTFRIVTENAAFSTPEVAVGFHTDCSASYFLPRLPGHLGEYLALTGSKLDCADMLACGIATHFVPSKDVPELEKTLLNLQPESSIQEAIQGFAKMPEAEASSVMKRMTWINSCFSKDRVEEIIESLASTNDEWCKETARSLRRLSPIALKQALASIRQGRTQSLKKCLEREQRITLNCLRSLVSDDLYEGIRAVVVDKDRAPKWNPSTLAEVTDDMVEMILNTYTAREQIQLPLEGEERWSGKYLA